MPLKIAEHVLHDVLQLERWFRWRQRRYPCCLLKDLDLCLGHYRFHPCHSVALLVLYSVSAAEQAEVTTGFMPCLMHTQRSNPTSFFEGENGNLRNRSIPFKLTSISIRSQSRPARVVLLKGGFISTCGLVAGTRKTQPPPRVLNTLPPR